jgi:site-specific recombinase XerD
MLEELFRYPLVVARHKNAPYVDERERFLTHCAQKGYPRKTLSRIAGQLLLVARNLSVYPEFKLTSDQIKASADQWAYRQERRATARDGKVSHRAFRLAATRWLRFLGRLCESVRDPIPFPGLIEDFTSYMENERGLSPRTIETRCTQIAQFLRWYGALGRQISEIQVIDVDRFLAGCSSRGLSRVSIAHVASILRAFFKHAGGRGWCHPSITGAIEGPRIFAQENLPSGPAWDDVKQLLVKSNTSRSSDIRSRAVIMLFVIYGLRATEVSELLLEDIDWDHDQILIRRSKQRRFQRYPLMPVVGNAIIRYLKEVRPQSARREVFLTFRPPHRPLSRSSLFGLTRARMAEAGIQSPHQGPHSLRHACATHLVSEGFSLKEISDHLGHRSLSATQIYAKVDLRGLREVANFDLGGLT